MAPPTQIAKAGNFDICVCALFERFSGPALDEFKALLDTMIALTTILKTYAMLIINFQELVIKKTKAELELAVIQEVLDVVAIPFNLVLQQTRMLSDCPPVSTFARQVKTWRNIVVAPIEEREFQIEQLLAMIGDKTNKIASLTKLIEFFEDMKTAIDECGET